MAKSDQKTVQNKLYKQSDQIDSDYKGFQSGLQKPISETWDRGTNDYTNAAGGYKQFQDTGGLDPAAVERMRAALGGAGGGGGGISNPLSGRSSNYAGLSSAYGSAYRPDYSEADRGFRDLASSTGGFDQGKLNQIYGNTDQLSEIGRTGGITDADYKNVNRDSLLEQERTGGYSDKDIQNIRARSASSSPAFFGAVKDQMDQGRRITGNLAGAGATDFKLARQAAQQQNQDKIGAEIGMQDSIRAGRSDAGKFLSDANYNLTGLRTGNQLAGAGAAGQMGLATQGAITGNRLQGLQGLAGSQTNLGQWGLGQAGGLDQFGLSRAGGMDSWDLNNAQMDMSAASANSSAGRANAQQQADLEKYLMEYGNRNKQWGIEGANDLYKTNLGANRDYMGMSLDGLNSQYGNQANMLGLAAQNRGNTMMENAQGFAGAIGGGLGTLTGLGGFGGGGQGSGIPQNSGVNPIYGGSGMTTADKLAQGYYRTR